MNTLIDTVRRRDDTRSRGARLLGIYLNDHLAGATAGVRLAYRLGRSEHVGGADRLLRLADEIAADRAELLDVMAELGVPVTQVKVLLGAALERAGHLKLNGRIFSHSPLSSVDELEMLRLGVEGKAAAWRTLRIVAERSGRPDPLRLMRLEARAREQIDVVEELRLAASSAAFSAH